MSNEEVERILKCRNYYQLLKVQQNFEFKDLKNNYQEIALKVHPDRCKHPNSTKAFQKLNNAYKTLKDNEKKRIYDLTGESNEQTRVRPNNEQQYYYEDDIFSFFFGPQPAQRRRRRPQNENIENNVSIFSILKIFPLLIPLLMIILPNLNISNLINFKSFFKPINRKSVKPILNFEDIKGIQTFSRKSFKYGIQYFIPVWWLQNLNNGMSMKEIENKLDNIADILYKEDIEIKCELEKNKLKKESIYCSKLKKLN